MRERSRLSVLVTAAILTGTGALIALLVWLAATAPHAARPARSGACTPAASITPTAVFPR